MQLEYFKAKLVEKKKVEVKLISPMEAEYRLLKFRQINYYCYLWSKGLPKEMIFWSADERKKKKLYEEVLEIDVAKLNSAHVNFSKLK